MSGKYPDAHNAGRSRLVPFVPGEAPMQRHDRRLAENLRQVETMQRWAVAQGLTLTVRNDGHHWEFKRTDGQRFVVDWWPSSAKMVIGKQWDRGIHVHDHEQARREIARRMPTR